MTAALTSRNYIKTFQFSAGQRTVPVSVMSSTFPAADRSTLTDQRLKSFVDRSQLFLSVAQPGHLLVVVVVVVVVVFVHFVCCCSSCHS